jgi:DNA-binding CsgD family transcriptional regulator
MRPDYLKFLNWLHAIGDFFARFKDQSNKLDPPERVRRRWRSLTMRQQQVAALVGLNYTYQQIADSLYITRHTARTHTRNALRKLHLKNKAELRQALLILEEQGVINLQAYSRYIEQGGMTD